MQRISTDRLDWASERGLVENVLRRTAPEDTATVALGLSCPRPKWWRRIVRRPRGPLWRSWIHRPHARRTARRSSGQSTGWRYPRWLKRKNREKKIKKNIQDEEKMSMMQCEICHGPGSSSTASTTAVGKLWWINEARIPPPSPMSRTRTLCGSV